MTTLCRKCNHPHISDEQNISNVCTSTNPMCMCSDFHPHLELFPKLSQIDMYMAQFEKMIDKMQWVLLNVQFFRNYNNKDIVFAWWQYVNHWNPKWQPLTMEVYKRLDQPESITRARRYWKQRDFDKYGPLSKEVAEQQSFKQFAIEEFLVMNK